MAHWLKQTHPDYHERRWRVIKRHLHGGILDNLSEHLVRKRQGEADQEFKSRADIASYVPHFQRAVLALAGMITQNEKDAERGWWDGLGTPEEMDTPVGRLWQDIDGQGTDWPVLKTQALVDLTGFQKIWTLVEGVERLGDERTQANARNDGSVTIMSPLAVKDWVRDDTGRLVEVKVEVEVDSRGSVMEDSSKQTRYHVYKLSGYQVWAEGQDGPVNISAQVSGQAEGGTIPYGPDGFTYTGQHGRDTLPIYPTRVPVRAPVGYMMAKFAEWLFNFRNTRNFHLWASALARMYSDMTDDSGHFDEDLFEKMQDLLKQGSKFFPKEIGYAAPPMDGAEVRNQTLEKEKEDFYSVFFQSYGQVATERTATEIRQDIAQSVGAYLTLQTEALDEWENDMLLRLGQVNAPDAGLETWNQAFVSRNTDFAELAVMETLQELRQGSFEGGQVPMGQTAKANAAKTWLNANDVDFDEQEVEDAVRVQNGTMDLVSRIRDQRGQDGGLEL
jgi:hypothetical protein